MYTTKPNAEKHQKRTPDDVSPTGEVERHLAPVGVPHEVDALGVDGQALDGLLFCRW